LVEINGPIGKILKVAFEGRRKAERRTEFLETTFVDQFA
jgi:hypothetical protein